MHRLLLSTTSKHLRIMFQVRILTVPEPLLIYSVSHADFNVHDRTLILEDFLINVQF